MSTRNWAVGETVHLKSGSPAMTVTEVGHDGRTTATWYEQHSASVTAERSLFATASFPKDCLTTEDLRRDLLLRQGLTLTNGTSSIQPIQVEVSCQGDSKTADEMALEALRAMQRVFRRVAEEEAGQGSPDSLVLKLSSAIGGHGHGKLSKDNTQTLFDLATLLHMNAFGTEIASKSDPLEVQTGSYKASTPIVVHPAAKEILTSTKTDSSRQPQEKPPKSK